MLQRPTYSPLLGYRGKKLHSARRARDPTLGSGEKKAIWRVVEGKYQAKIPVMSK
jgi:hypothetical protein